MSVFNCNYSQTRNRHDPSPPSVVLSVVTSVHRSDDCHPLCVTHSGSLASSVWWRSYTRRLTSTARLDSQQHTAAVCCSHPLLVCHHRVLLSRYLPLHSLARCPSTRLPFYIPSLYNVDRCGAPLSIHYESTIHSPASPGPDREDPGGQGAASIQCQTGEG